MLLRDLISPDRPENVRFLLGDNRSPPKIASLAAQILRVNGGFARRRARHRSRRRPGITVDAKAWLEVYIGDHWQGLSVATGEPRIPRN